jgi:predicted  nucleic acid-binding Zn-ribbon protein
MTNEPQILLAACLASLLEEYEAVLAQLDELTKDGHELQACFNIIKEMKELDKQMSPLTNKGERLRNQYKSLKDKLKNASTTGEIQELREAQSHLQNTHDQVMSELNSVLANRDSLQSHLEQKYSNLQISNLDSLFSKWRQTTLTLAEVGQHLEDLQGEIEELETNSQT